MNNTLRKWLGALALAFVMATLALQFGSAKAQYEFGDPRTSQGASAAMLEKGGFLYIVQGSANGSTLHKIRMKDLAVAGRLNLIPAATPFPTATATYYPGEGTPTATPSATFTTAPTATPSS